MISKHLLYPPCAIGSNSKANRSLISNYETNIKILAIFRWMLYLGGGRCLKLITVSCGLWSLLHLNALLASDHGVDNDNKPRQTTWSRSEHLTKCSSSQMSVRAAGGCNIRPDRIWRWSTQLCSALHLLIQSIPRRCMCMCSCGEVNSELMYKKLQKVRYDFLIFISVQRHFYCQWGQAMWDKIRFFFAEFHRACNV